MPLTAEQRKITLFEELMKRWRTRLEPNQADSFDAFIHGYFAAADPDDVIYTSFETLLAGATSLWEFGAQRQPGLSKIRIFNPTFERNGWSLDHTVIEIVTDDMPFLVDSVSMEIRRERNIHLALHAAAMRLRRDEDGNRMGVTDTQGAPKDAVVESYIHIEVSQETEPGDLEAFRTSIERVLAAVRAAVTDWRSMRAKLVDEITHLDSVKPPMPAETVEETRAFLKWLDDGNFIFLGFRSYRFEPRDGRDYLPIDPNSGLGILREIRREVVEHGEAPLSAEFSTYARQQDLLNITKTNSRSLIHRPVPMDRIGIKRYDAGGNLIGEDRFLGLFTSAAYSLGMREIPVLRLKAKRVIERGGLDPESHDGKALIDILETFPRDEFFQIADADLFEISRGILLLQVHVRQHLALFKVALFTRKDVFKRFVVCYVFVPRDRYTPDFKERARQILEAAFEGRETQVFDCVTNLPLAHGLFIVRTQGGIPDIDTDHVEALLDKATWSVEAQIGTLTDEPPVAQPHRLLEAESREQSGRTYLAAHAYHEASEELMQASSLDPASAPRITAEFGFLFSLEPVLADRRRLRWCTNLWRMLTVVLAGQIRIESISPPFEAAALGPVSIKPAAPRQSRKSSQAKGGELEDATLRLFQRFFCLAEQDEAALRVQLKKLRRQRAGSQYGYDLAFEVAVTEAGSVRCHVECKNYASSIPLKDVADKLLQQKSHTVKIDHWILISPNANPTQDLHHFLEYESTALDFPFDIHVWSPETGVEQFFALEPLLYERFYPDGDPVAHPRHWTAEMQAGVVDRYRSLLRPVYRLPRGWKQYVDNDRHLSFSESERFDFERTYSSFVPIGVKDQNGVELPGTAIERLTAWLAEPSPRVAFVLGEFGDGKSFLSYLLCKELLKSFRVAPESGVIPVRLALREFRSAVSVREFLQARLEMFDADPAGWTALKQRYRTLVILDGFDEISNELDPRTITANIRALIDCCTAPIFDESKILITSRTHFFETGDASRLLQRLGTPLLLQLGRIPRGQVLGHLQDAAKGPQERELLLRLSRMHDPIGLGTKPLFLQMLKETLHELPTDLDEVSVYESYARRTLERKIEMLDDPEVRSVRGNSIDQLLGALGIIAEELQRSSDPYVSLKNMRHVTGPFAELLWRLTGDEVLESDAEARIGTRSLLSRVKALEGDGQWLVDFCHRSIREYFVARRFGRCLSQGAAEAAEFLGTVPVNHEILYFAASLIRRSGDHRALASLRELITDSSVERDTHSAAGKALTVLLRVAPAVPRDLDLRARNFDFADLEDGNLSGLDFSGSTFRGANFSNANIEHANLSNCDLTDVRLHETTSVLAVAANSAHRIVAAYEDGTVWEWDLGSGGKPAGRIVFAQQGLRFSRLGVTSSGTPWGIAGREALLFDMAPDQWRCMARIPLRQKCADFHVEERTVAVLLTEQDSRCLVADLEQQTFAIAREMPESPAFVSLTPGTLCFRSDDTSIHIVGERFDAQIEVPNATSLRVASDSGGDILVAVGDGNGVLRIFALQIDGEKVTVEPLFAEPVHEGPVFSVTFCDLHTVASGGLDRRIILTPFRGPSTPRRNLQLSLRCSGLNTTNLKPDSQRKRLNELKLRASRTAAVT